MSIIKKVMINLEAVVAYFKVQHPPGGDMENHRNP
jgi:hypothetical protein